MIRRDRPPRKTIVHRFKQIKTRLGIVGKMNQFLEKGPDHKKEFTFDQKTFRTLLQKIAFTDSSYIYSNALSPNIQFYKFLAAKIGKHPCKPLQLDVPDTIVFNDSAAPVWIYTSIDGEVHRTETVDNFAIIERFRQDLPWDAGAVLKLPAWNKELGEIEGLKTSALNEIDLTLRLRDLRDGKMSALQKFVKCKGPVPFICRTVYKKHGRSLAYIISNKCTYRNKEAGTNKRCLVDVEEKGTYNVITTESGRYLQDTLPGLERLCHFLEISLKVEFIEIAADFLKDENDKWWFVTCKAFRMKVEEIPLIRYFAGETVADESETEEDVPKTIIAEYERLKRCRLCQRPLSLDKLTHHLTIEMITFTDQHLRERGVMIEWLDRAEYRHSGHATIYESYSVCSSCYELYELTAELKEIEELVVDVFGLEPTGKPEEDQFLNEWEFSENPVKIVNKLINTGMTSDGRSRPMKYYKVLFIISDIQEVKEMPLELKVEFEMVGVHRTFKVKPQILQTEGCIPIEQFRVFEFFSESRYQYRKFLEEHPSVAIKFSKFHKVLGTVTIELQDFKNPIVKQKKYYKLLSETLGYLNCQVSIVEEEEKINTAHIELTPFSTVFVPKSDFWLCRPFPEEWLDILPDLNEYVSLLNEQHHSSIELKGNSISVTKDYFQPVQGREKIIYDYKILKNSPLEGIDASPGDSKLIFNWNAFIKTESEIFGISEYSLSIKLPKEYPFGLPSVKFYTETYHPNINEQGILKLEKAYEYDIRSILLKIKEVLENPDWNKAVRKELKEQYQTNSSVFYETAKSFRRRSVRHSY